MATITTRAAEAEDAASIRDLVRAAYAQWVPVIGREPMPMTVDYAQAVASHDFLLAEEQGRLVGLVETMAHADHLWIENVAVDPARQGSGIGRLLLAAAEERARRMGVPELRLLTNAAFARNVEFYGRLGFVVTSEEPFMGGITLRLSKHLLAQA